MATSSHQPQAAKKNKDLLLPMEGGITVSVPKPLRNLSTFVLKEQGDWFEQEIKFLRQLIQPGMKVMDIGANYGMYALMLAKAVGPSGHVWAFEPASETVRHLNKSVEANQFGNVSIIAKGLSKEETTATFYLSTIAELNSLNLQDSNHPTETITLTTLDNCLHQYQWNELDFIKLDAEGEESRILEGGHQLLTQLSPLVMFELKHAKQVNLPLINQFRQLGYDTYYLLPGLNVLAPFDPTEEYDPFLLNLFCCKPDRADQLKKQGFLVDTTQWLPGEKVPDVTIASADYLADHSTMQKVMATQSRSPDEDDVESLRNFYLASLDKKRSMSERAKCLQQAYQLSMRKPRDTFGFDHCELHIAAVHARIALDIGEQYRAVEILQQAVEIDDDEPVAMSQLYGKWCLPVATRYQELDPGEKIFQWLLSSMLEQWVECHAYSSYYTVQKALPALERIQKLGFADERMKHRHGFVAALRLNS